MNWFDTHIKKDALYKIVMPQDYNAANKNNCITLSNLDKTSGFIHASYGRQAERTVKKFFEVEPIVLLIELDKNILAQHGIIIKEEQNKPDAPFFPHLYGTSEVPLSAVKNVVTYSQK